MVFYSFCTYVHQAYNIVQNLSSKIYGNKHRTSALSYLNCGGCLKSIPKLDFRHLQEAVKGFNPAPTSVE